jgi:hypothetical protein
MILVAAITFGLVRLAIHFLFVVSIVLMALLLGLDCISGEESARARHRQKS